MRQNICPIEDLVAIKLTYASCEGAKRLPLKKDILGIQRMRRERVVEAKDRRNKFNGFQIPDTQLIMIQIKIHRASFLCYARGKFIFLCLLFFFTKIE